MNSCQWGRLLLAFVVLAVECLTQAGTTATLTDEQPVSSATPSPGVTDGLKSTSPLPATNDSINVRGESGTPFADNQTSTAATAVSPINGQPVSSATTSSGVTDGVNSTIPLPGTNNSVNVTGGSTGTPFEDTPIVGLPEACVCDLTPDFCNIGCCCDIADCGVADLSTVFKGCPQKATSGVCIEKWLMFRANVDSSLVSVTESLFCVQSAAEHLEVPTVPLQLPVLGDSYHFSSPQPISVGHSRHFYRADDVIQTVFTKSSVRGLLRQPSPGAAGAFCLSRNPARFLRSQSLSCTRMVNPQSCTKDPNLSALSYFTELSLIKIPKPAEEQVSDLLIPVSPLSDWPAPSEETNLCVNVAKKVEFVIVYTDRGELASATVNVVLEDVKMNQLLQQVHSIQYKLGTSRPSPMPTIPSVGLRVGSSVLGGFNGEVKPVTIMGLPQASECSSDPATRTNILFTHNRITGCRFSSPSRNCAELRSQIDSILQGAAVPDVIATSSGSQPDWATVLKQECPVSSEETCDSGCTLPHLLSVQVLWARMGLLDLPQSYILGVKYLFRCQKFQCPLSSTIALTTEVAFADMTVYPKTVLETGSP
ncbi:tectonic-3-like isoform X1 [Phyllopteryx taeniolatus]|uniref:tectonic-3-like isoform X1 n=1 Tax=Phyllopteryx taeniolatus TaxID=161469 RepID=UPI002AD263B0|nr:tectonic-3-like isoform X1 [Phyllopteryx taeniolatus]